MAVTADVQPSEFPLQVPARMLTEFTYCPRHRLSVRALQSNRSTLGL